MKVLLKILNTSQLRRYFRIPYDRLICVRPAKPPDGVINNFNVLHCNVFKPPFLHFAAEYVFNLDFLLIDVDFGYIS